MPLALSVVIMGGALALQFQVFSTKIFLLSVLTAVFLQVLSNFANDYGDAVSGVDNEKRVGEKRAVASGLISKESMLRAIIVMVILSLVSGIFLLVEASENLKFTGFVTLFLVGIFSILAAIFYTMGKHPYGYIGLGDLMVFIFFGLVGVEGSFTLYNGVPFGSEMHSCFIYVKNSIPSCVALLPALAIGLFSVAVINLNNLRDYQTDKETGKRTLVVRFGTTFARIYQCLLLVLGIAFLIIFILYFGKNTEFLCLISLPLFLKNIICIIRNNAPIDGELKIVSLATFITSIGFLIGAGL